MRLFRAALLCAGRFFFFARCCAHDVAVKSNVLKSVSLKKYDLLQFSSTVCLEPFNI